MFLNNLFIFIKSKYIGVFGVQCIIPHHLLLHINSLFHKNFDSNISNKSILEYEL